ncbi:MAG: hypothetical protein RR748_20845 [Pseudomonas sp.]
MDWPRENSFLEFTRPITPEGTVGMSAHEIPHVQPLPYQTMTPEETMLLNERHPRLGGIYPECNSGWFTIIDVLCAELQRQTDKYKAPQLVVTQIKQKFGTLRFHVACFDTATDEIADEGYASDTQVSLIAMAARLSARTCEICGRPGTMQEREWIQALCIEHAAN